jgi:2-keto-4-pentenoate hydratase/2-oxohepta-3-ene-1,7-dioic acid hydratase in catechol pathway
MLFPRYPESLVAAGQPLIRPKVSEKFDFEGELAFVIGKAGRHIPAERARDHVAGYACLNDGSLRDFQRHTTQFLPGKNFAASGSFGPWLVTPDDVGDLARQTIETRLNGEVMQKATFDDLLFGVEELIAYMSTIWTIQPGDVVATGTTGGRRARSPILSGRHRSARISWSDLLG